MYEAEAPRYPSIKFYQIDADELKTVAEDVAIPGLPSVVLFKNGKSFKIHSGIKLEPFQEALSELCGVPPVEAGVASAVAPAAASASSGAVAPSAQTTAGAATASAPAKVKEPLIASIAQLEEYTKQHKFVLIKCYADWCMPCRSINPHWDSWVNNPEYNAWIAFARVNVDADDDLTQLLGAEKLPTFKFFAEGKDVATLEGTDSAQIQTYVEKFVKKSVKYHNGVAPNAATGAAPAASPAPAAPAAPAAAAAPAAPAPSPEAKSSSAPTTVAGLATGSRTGLVPSVSHLPFVTPYDQFQRAIKEHTYTLVCFIANGDKLKDAQSQVQSVINQVSDAFAQVYVDASKDLQLADCYGVFPDKCPVYKLLHKGIHFATLYQPSNDALASKLRELLAL